RRRPARPREGARGRDAARRVVLGARPGGRGGGGLRARRAAGRGGSRRLPDARRAAQQPGRAEGAGRRPRGRGGAGAHRPQARARQGQSGHAERAVVTPEQDARAFRALTRKISDARGVVCEAYKEKCLRRRIAVRMRARGVHTFEDYARLLDGDAGEYDLLLDALTINVTKFFRNAETWRALAPYLVELWERRRGEVRVWSAGCASGEEPYTIAVALAEPA